MVTPWVPSWGQGAPAGHSHERHPCLAACFRTSGPPENSARVERLCDAGLRRPDGVERDLGRHLGPSS
ncbi:hypothetical protein [Streptomyces sp. NPDC056628]|uniref:hypothetical protein n=1 Tax=Streptomyces sp. NPDC056628 TaxID=3345882 RepID=UPI0036C57DE0